MQQESSSPEIRQATLADLDQLLEVCRQSFPESLRRQANRLARRWWKAVIVTKTAETWVVEQDGHIRAFCVLVKDEILWLKEAALRSSSIMLNLFSALRHPLASCHCVSRMLNRALRKIAKPAPQAPMPSEWSPRMRTWVEMIATRPDSRGRGLARRLLEQCDVRAKELGRKAVGLRVESDNTAAKSLYEKCGYVRLRSDSRGDVYANFLEK